MTQTEVLIQPGLGHIPVAYHIGSKDPTWVVGCHYLHFTDAEVKSDVQSEQNGRDLILASLLLLLLKVLSAPFQVNKVTHGGAR